MARACVMDQAQAAGMLLWFLIALPGPRSDGRVDRHQGR